ncbi:MULTISPECIES: TetR/AcrR family transcriptional regulator [unclassified Staphylococcus]|uniref:TetR/AcrR family transcriptional regulator n=1 Tax=unclassified Staphylococcus TaxID=91994 RepID=UPI0021CF7720|nr:MULTISPECIES: TetR/AcrR family transcriptional regulator [unclassified Staphylococcus]UXR71057.1 TetR/AcrR family transcriptional regulator [Staphylococcus sp. IVB6240]UXR73282.1 TetR/AcrR family transcriptional regulator [Staphylococcus sp. IVB6238]UXR75582.1 TetR/AcrR family transcriptional regulator [Staphylococcus sp. IVB6233]UXR79783.1 TetR/AcrR family transcriptional regulator [Staphylococcus sp. IVB6218]
MIQDLRFRKVEENLRAALLTLLKEKTYQKITVTDICQTAKCSRNAFYLHYESKENLYQAILIDIIVDIEESCRPVVENFSDIGVAESKEYLTNILNAVEHHRPILSQLLENKQVNFSDSLKQSMIEAMRTYSKKINHDPDLDNIHYTTSGIVGFIEYWVVHTDYTLEEAKERLFTITFQNTHSENNLF